MKIEEIKELLAEILNMDVKEISENTSQEDIVDWDSLKQLNIISSLEENYNIEFEDGHIEKLNSVSNIYKIVSQLIGK